eukprot:c20553_g1_i1 orf=764-2080(-)
MDDIFEQMLSTSPWADGVGMNRASWDATIAGAANNMSIDSAVELQALHKASTMPLMPLLGGVNSQGHGRALQEGNAALSPNGIFDTGQGHGVLGPHHLQPMAPMWYGGGVPQAHSGLGQGGKPDALPTQGDVPLDTHLGKRLRDTMEDGMPLDGLSRNMGQATTNQGVQSVQGYGDQATLGQDPTGGAANGAGRPRVRARRGQATDPHSIAERNRRERIAERMKALQELVPDSNKTDKASMLDEIIGYVKFLQMQVKCLSMCRLGGVGAAAPLLADLPGTEGAGNFLASNMPQASGGSGTSLDGMAFAERQVARLMDEDMSAAMQYLQSKGLCLMPISLATAISSTGSRQPAKGPEVAGNMKQAMEMQAAAVAAAAAAAAAVGGSATASMMASLACNTMGQDGGSPSASIARALIQDLQRDEEINEKALLNAPSNKHR